MVDPSAAQAEKEERWIRAAEQKHHHMLSTMETVLSLGDFQRQIDTPISPESLIQLTVARAREMIPSSVSAIYFVDQQSARLELSCCMPESMQDELTGQFARLTENGYTAWALREPRGMMVYSPDKRHRVLFHTMATYARIRGLFVALFPPKDHRLPDGSLQCLSLVLRNAANTLESLEYLAMFQRQNAELQTRVDEKVGELRSRDHQLLNARKMDAIATLAGGVAHQYNNALSVLVGNLDLIKLDIAHGRDISTCLERIEATSHKMQDLTSKLVAYAYGGKYNPQTVPIQNLVERALEGIRNQLKAQIALKLVMPEDNCAIHVDVTQIQLALTAIITNAMEALETGGRIHIEAEKVTLEDLSPEDPGELKPGEYVLLQITDNGRGMDEETCRHIFDPFFSTKLMGRGLSMAAAYGIVKNHHGEISVSSVVGQGTTVRVYMPLFQDV